MDQAGMQRGANHTVHCALRRVRVGLVARWLLRVLARSSRPRDLAWHGLPTTCAAGPCRVWRIQIEGRASDLCVHGVFARALRHPRRFLGVAGHQRQWRRELGGILSWRRGQRPTLCRFHRQGGIGQGVEDARPGRWRCNFDGGVQQAEALHGEGSRRKRWLGIRRRVLLVSRADAGQVVLFDGQGRQPGGCFGVDAVLGRSMQHKGDGPWQDGTAASGPRNEDGRQHHVQVGPPLRQRRAPERRRGPLLCPGLGGWLTRKT
mmetsp:Transcript_6977/g.20747  ORF Transcript_6977/g.20747 Transcript_6977/m.20747 type:complete len:262 (+) Transcript_6977:1170-1955(+)